MPRYDYLCKCGHKWDVIEPHDATRVRKCVECGGRAIRLFPCPNIITDATFMKGRKMLGDQLQAKDLKYRLAQARRAGYRPSPNDVYMPTIAEYAGDPKAFVPAGNARSHIKKVCENMGASCEEMGVKLGQSRETEAPKLAPKLIRQKAQEMIQKDPSLAKRSSGEIAELVVSKYGRK